MGMHKTLSTLSLCFVFILSLLVNPLDASNEDYDLWYTVMMAGKPSGYSHQSAKRKDNGNFYQESQTQITIARQAIRLTVRIDSTFEETDNGKAISGSMTQSLGAMKVKQTFLYNQDGSITLNSEQNGQKVTQQIPKPNQDWLTPTQSQKFVQQQLAKGEKSISFWTIDPTSGPQPIEIIMKHLGPEQLQVVGKIVPSIKWEMSTSLMPGMISTAWTDDNIIPLKTSVTPMPGMQLDVVLSDKNLATQQVNPPELLISTMITPDRPLPNPRKLKYAEYELHIKSGQTPVSKDTFLQTATQTVHWVNDQQVKITVNTQSKAQTQQAPTAEYLQVTSVLNHNDPKIKEAIILALGKNWKTLSPMDRAFKLRRFVNHEIKRKDLSVGFATASEVIRTKQGDCSEHGVLLAAMLRGVNIPSRIVSGVIYVDQFLNQKNIFGYHMWTQAWINGRWVDLDATLHNDFDAAHIAIGASSTQNGQTFNDMVKLTPLFGRLEIKVKKVR